MTNGTLLKDYSDVFLKWEASGYIEKFKTKTRLDPMCGAGRTFQLLKKRKKLQRLIQFLMERQNSGEFALTTTFGQAPL
jgi:hypothetical protein